MSRQLTLALAQMDCEPGNPEKNLARVIEHTHRARAMGAQIVAFPELILSGANLDALGARINELALTRGDEPIQKLARAARTAGVYLLAGFLERRDNSGAVYNSLAFCAPNGTVVDTYAKTHMYMTERKYFSFGHQSRVYETEFGKIGIMICYELCFPEVARIRALQGAEVLIAPAAWGTLES